MSILNKKIQECEADAFLFPMHSSLDFSKEGVMGKNLLKFGGLEL